MFSIRYTSISISKSISTSISTSLVKHGRSPKSLSIINYIFFIPKYNPFPLCTTFIPLPLVANLIKSGVADKAALGFLLAAALPILRSISNALTGLLATFFPKLTVALPTLLKKIFTPSASIVA